MLLRTLGIPARLVTGFAFGDTQSQPGMRVMRASDAHAWVQFWSPGVGWVDADPTAGATLASPAVAAAGSSGSNAAAPSAAPSHLGVTAAAGTWLRSAGRGLVGGQLAAGVGTVAIAGLVRWLILGRRRRRVPLPESGSQVPLPRGTPGPVLDAYLRFDAALAIARGRVMAETPREVVMRLGPDTAFTPEVTVALDLLERECYGVEPLAEADAAAAVAVFDSLRELCRTSTVGRHAGPVGVR